MEGMEGREGGGEGGRDREDVSVSRREVERRSLP